MNKFLWFLAIFNITVGIKYVEIENYTHMFLNIIPGSMLLGILIFKWCRGIDE